MLKLTPTTLSAVTLGAALMFGALTPLSAADDDHGHDHAHESGNGVYEGYFDDAQVEDRTLSDWEGAWQSVYPYLMDGTLDAFIEHKAAHGDLSAAEYREYYETGYRTDVDRIVISDQTVTFHDEDGAVTGRYEGDGYEILTYDAGNRGVRYIFEKIGGDEAAPGFIQFSDHRIAPEPADHFHLYWGDDRAALLEELTNWPTYYPAALDEDALLAEMVAH